MMKKPKPPCVADCPGRSMTCHVDCKRYIDYTKKNKKYNEAVKAEKNKDADAKDMRIGRAEDWNRRRRR